MQREVIWTPWSGPGLEHLRLNADDEAVTADGLIIGLDAGRAFRVRYTIRCDGGWRVRGLCVSVLDGGDEGPAPLRLLADGAGHWTTVDGEPLPALDGCIDVDLSVTPFTNTLPIKRLGWQRGESAELLIAYIELPALRVTAERRRYTCLDEPPPAAGRFHIESLSSGFTADLPIDGDGLVWDYPGLFSRVWSSP
jgi:hypothetical protein